MDWNSIHTVLKRESKGEVLDLQVPALTCGHELWAMTENEIRDTSVLSFIECLGSPFGCIQTEAGVATISAGLCCGFGEHNWESIFPPAGAASWQQCCDRCL